MQTNIHALNGIRTHDSSVRESEDSSCLRPNGHCDRPCQLLDSTKPTAHSTERRETVRKHKGTCRVTGLRVRSVESSNEAVVAVALLFQQTTHLQSLFESVDPAKSTAHCVENSQVSKVDSPVNVGSVLNFRFTKETSEII
jgi:hypothetical protein